MYQNLYNLINQYVFSGSIVSGEYTDLVCTLISTIGCLSLVALPFFIVYKIVKFLIMG